MNPKNTRPPKEEINTFTVYFSSTCERLMYRNEEHGDYYIHFLEDGFNDNRRLFNVDKTDVIRVDRNTIFLKVDYGFDFKKLFSFRSNNSRTWKVFCEGIHSNTEKLIKEKFPELLI